MCEGLARVAACPPVSFTRCDKNGKLPFTHAHAQEISYGVRASPPVPSRRRSVTRPFLQSTPFHVHALAAPATQPDAAPYTVVEEGMCMCI